jgi:hypothetical protein
MTETEDPNPLQKLFAGICSPQQPIEASMFSEDDSRDAVNDQYAVDLSPEPTSAEPSASDATATSTEDEPTTTTTDTATDVSSSESPPEDDISKNVTANRRKYGFGYFIIACIFVVATLFSLQQLGFTIADFDFSGSSSGIQVVDKSSIEEEVKVEPVAEETPTDEDDTEDEAEASEDEL